MSDTPPYQNEYEEPLHPTFYTNLPKMARAISYRETWALWVIAVAIVATAAILEWFSDKQFDPIARSGYLLVLLGIGHYALLMRKSRFMGTVKSSVMEIFTNIEKDKIRDTMAPADLERRAKVLANRRVERAYPEMMRAIEQHFLFHNLCIVAVGNILAGFGDLLD